MGVVAFSRPSVISIFSSMMGLMPCSHDFSRAGVMINMVINKARAIRTILGGVALVDKAERVMEKTTINRVNEVIITTIEGASERTVMSANTLRMRAEAEPVDTSPRLRLTFCARAESQFRIIRARAIMGKNIFLVIWRRLSSGWGVG